MSMRLFGVIDSTISAADKANLQFPPFGSPFAVTPPDGGFISFLAFWQGGGGIASAFNGYPWFYDNDLTGGLRDEGL